MIGRISLSERGSRKVPAAAICIFPLDRNSGLLKCEGIRLTHKKMRQESFLPQGAQ